MKPPIIAGVVPGAGWVLEESATGTTLPLPGWAVTATGQLLPLPLSLGEGWRARPAHPDDAAALRRTALAYRGRPEVGPFGVLVGGIDDEATGRLL